jgi:DNA-binding GntR family transcriptional regulator
MTGWTTARDAKKFSLPSGYHTQEETMASKATRGGESMMTKVYVVLRRDILSCQILPGQELSEGDLAQRFKMSRTPVREALAKLRTEGLVKSFPRMGYQVAPVTFQDMNELFGLRTMLEARAVELASARITKEEISELRAMPDVVYDRAEQPSIQQFVQTNRDFHEAIARASGNVRLHAMIMQVLDQLQRFFYLGARLRDVSTETTASHKEMVDALEARDAVRARALMTEHNDETQRGLLVALTQQSSSVMQLAVNPQPALAAPALGSAREPRARRNSSS